MMVVVNTTHNHTHTATHTATHTWQRVAQTHGDLMTPPATLRTDFQLTLSADKTESVEKGYKIAKTHGYDLLIYDMGAPPFTLLVGTWTLQGPTGTFTSESLHLAVNAPWGTAFVNPPSPISRVLQGGSIPATFQFQALQKRVAWVRSLVHRLTNASRCSTLVRAGESIILRLICCAAATILGERNGTTPNRFNKRGRLEFTHVEQLSGPASPSLVLARSSVVDAATMVL